MKNYFLLLLISHLILHANGKCPYQCNCTSIHGKQTVDCHNQSFNIMPKDLPITTRILNFAGNNLPIISNGQFAECELMNLERLFLKHCNIKTIEILAFHKLTDMIELDLSENLLNSVPSTALSQCPSLFKLNLRKNPIEILHNRDFAELKFLNVLNLEGCQIAQVSPLSFSGLRNLEVLNLANNNLKYLDESTVLPMPLTEMQLQNNSWHCDCRIRSFRYWLQNEPKDVPYTPVCHSPEQLQGIPVKYLPYSEIGCTPEIVPSNFVYESTELDNLTLSCKAFVGQESNLTWSYSTGKSIAKPLENNTAIPLGVYVVFYTTLEREQSESTLVIFNRNLTSNLTIFCNVETSTKQLSTTYSIILKSVKKHTPLEKLVTAIGLSVFIIFLAILVYLTSAYKIVLLLFKCLLCENVCDCESKIDEDEDPEVRHIYTPAGPLTRVTQKIKSVVHIMQIPPPFDDNIDNNKPVKEPQIYANNPPPNANGQPIAAKTDVRIPRVTYRKNLSNNKQEQLNRTKERHPNEPYLTPTLMPSGVPRLSAAAIEKFFAKVPHEQDSIETDIFDKRFFDKNGRQYREFHYILLVRNDNDLLSLINECPDNDTKE